MIGHKSNGYRIHPNGVGASNRFCKPSVCFRFRIIDFNIIYHGLIFTQESDLVAIWIKCKGLHFIYWQSKDFSDLFIGLFLGTVSIIIGIHMASPIFVELGDRDASGFFEPRTK